MALAQSFVQQVKGLTSLSIGATGTGTAPSNEEVNTFLQDGVLDVTKRWITLKPQEADLFLVESDIQDSNGLDLDGAKLLSVVREAGVDGSSDGSIAWRECKKIPVVLQSRVVDPDSLYFASTYNPVFTITNDSVINVYPVPSSSNNGYKVYYINHSPVNSAGELLSYEHEDIKYFPKDKIYLVVMYAAIRAIENKLASYTVEDEDLEIVKSYQLSLAALREEYYTALPNPQPKQAAQPQQQRAQR